MTRFTAKKRRRFLEIIRVTGNVSYAAAQSGISRQAIYNHRDSNPEFAQEWSQAHEAGIEALEQEARRRAFSGVKTVDVHYDQNGNVNHRKVKTEYSDTLLIFLLKAAKPSTYRENIRIEHGFDSEIDRELARLGLPAQESVPRTAPADPNTSQLVS